MKKPKLKFWHSIAGLIILGAIEAIVWHIPSTATKFLILDLIEWASTIWLLLFFYIIIRNIVRAVKGRIARRNTGEAEELERQREIERKEVEMVRKSNEILLHLIQDEHREEDR